MIFALVIRNHYVCLRMHGWAKIAFPPRELLRRPSGNPNVNFESCILAFRHTNVLSER